MITIEQYNYLFSGEITKKQYDQIISKINNRFIEICEKFLKKNKSNAWYAYGNVSYKDENLDGFGFFDPLEYKENIAIGGEHIDPPMGFGLSFPTRWLWEDSFEAEFKEISQNTKKNMRLKKQNEKQRRETRKQEVTILKESIISKLTSQELAVIRFKL